MMLKHENKLDISYNLSDFKDEEAGTFENGSHKEYRTDSRYFPSVRLNT